MVCVFNSLQQFQIHFELKHGARTCKIRAGSDLWHNVQYRHTFCPGATLDWARLGSPQLIKRFNGSFVVLVIIIARVITLLQAQTHTNTFISHTLQLFGIVCHTLVIDERMALWGKPEQVHARAEQLHVQGFHQNVIEHSTTLGHRISHKQYTSAPHRNFQQ